VVGSCAVCRHLELPAIDAELRKAPKGRPAPHGFFCSIARRYDLPYKHVRRHAGRAEPRSGHISLSSPAPKVVCPSQFVRSVGSLDADALTLYLLRVSMGAGREQLLVSPASVREQLGVEFTERDLSLRLNGLSSKELISLGSRQSAGFPVSLRFS
jgi:hypothetical protein